MADSSKTVRKASNRKVAYWILQVVSCCLLGQHVWWGELLYANELSSAKGSTTGLFSEDPSWSAGLQIGAFETTGLTAQKTGFFSGALDIGLGLSGRGLLILDYVRFYDAKLNPLLLGPPGAYRTLRGNLLLFGGGGVELSKGSRLRLPLGVTYTMLRDPVQFFGAITLSIGPLFAERAHLELGPYFGCRLLL